MNAITRWLSIVGIGEDGLDGLSAAARTLIGQAGLVVGGKRHLELVAPAVTSEVLAWPSPPQAAFPAILERRFSPVCVVATGDPFFYGIGSHLSRAVAAEEMLCLPHISAFSLAASRLGWAVQDCELVTLHGRALETIIPHLRPRGRILALSWDETTPGRLAALLCQRGFGEAELIACAAMGGPRERIDRRRADRFDVENIDRLNLVAIELPAAGGRVIPLTPGLPDDWFEHDGQLTKRDVRALVLAALAPGRGEVLWDIGAGSGAVGIEWMLRHPTNSAYAIERDATRRTRIARNAAALGVPDLVIVAGAAPEILARLPVPDAVFIGGGATGDGVINACWGALRPGGRLVINGVTLETQAELTRRYTQHGGSLAMIQISHADPIGTFHALRPAMAVLQWAVTK